MRGIAFKTLRDGILDDIGQTGVTGTALTTAQGKITTAINQALDIAYPWMTQGWPELRRATSETVTSQIIDLDAITTGHWGVSRVIQCTRNHPHTSATPRPMEFTITSAGIVIRGVDIPSSLYVEHIEAPPVFTTTTWATSTAYVVGDVVLQTNDAYYCATAHTSGTFATDLAASKWQVLKIPAFLHIPVRTAVAAYIKGTGAQDQTKQQLLTLMERQLETVALRYENHS